MCGSGYAGDGVDVTLFSVQSIMTQLRLQNMRRDLQRLSNAVKAELGSVLEDGSPGSSSAVTGTRPRCCTTTVTHGASVRDVSIIPAQTFQAAS